MVSQINKENQWLLSYLIIYNVAVSISHTANAHGGKKTMRQFSERFSSCRRQQEYTQVGIRIFRFFRMDGSNRFPDRRRIPTCEARNGNPIDFPMLQWEFEEKPRPHYNRPQSWCAWRFPPYRIWRARKTDRASFPDRFHRDNATPQRWVSSFSYIPSLV